MFLANMSQELRTPDECWLVEPGHAFMADSVPSMSWTGISHQKNTIRIPPQAHAMEA
jgi:hypothetical protein